MNEVSYTLEPGKVFVFVPNTQFEWSTSDTSGVELYYTRFDYQMTYKEKEKWVNQPSSAAPFPMFGEYSLKRPQEVLQLFERLYAKSQKLDPLSQLHANLLFRELWLTIIKNIYDLHNSGDTDSTVEATLHYITDHYRSPLTVEELAEMAGLSPGYYCKKFYRLTGYNPKEYIIQLRMNKAKEMLSFNEHSLKDIAKFVGYDDVFYFSRLFKRVTGASPSNYEKRPE